MKKLLLIPLALLFVPTAALADYRQGGGVEETACYETVYREEYIPGTSRNPGRVRNYRERVEVPCRDQGYRGGIVPNNDYGYNDYDDNSCIEGAIIGGIAGGAAGGTLATQENWIWSIPAGLIGGAMVGCQIDGG